MEETGRGHRWWDRLKRREEHRSVNHKRISKNIPSCTFSAAWDIAPPGSWLSKDLQMPLPCQALCCSLLLISPATYCHLTSGSQVLQVLAMAQRLILSLLYPFIMLQYLIIRLFSLSRISCRVWLPSAPSCAKNNPASPHSSKSLRDCCINKSFQKPFSSFE